MATRYFQKQDATRAVNGIVFDGFDIIGSSLWGVYATDDPETITTLEAAVADKKLGVYEISHGEYLATQQKKISSSNSFANSNKPVPVVRQSLIQGPTPPTAVKGAGAVVEAEPAPKVDDGPPADSGKLPVEKVDDAFTIDVVAPSLTAPVRNTRRGRPPKQPPTENV